MAEEPKFENASGLPYRIDCHRSYLHRYLPADGVWVGLNGHQKIILNFYNDSPLLPKSIMAETTPDGKKFIPKEPKISLETDGQSFRQFEISVNIPVAAASRLAETLKTFIKMAEDAEKLNAPEIK